MPGAIFTAGSCGGKQDAFDHVKALPEPYVAVTCCYSTYYDFYERERKALQLLSLCTLQRRNCPEEPPLRTRGPTGVGEKALAGIPFTQTLLIAYEVEASLNVIVDLARRDHHIRTQNTSSSS